MQVYISVSHHKRRLLNQFITAIQETLEQKDFSAFVFVDHYKFTQEQEKEMMQQAMQDIDASAILIAEASDKGIGIGIEAGYAKAKGKQLIYVRHKDAEHSTTLSGLCDFHIHYNTPADLQSQLEDILSKMVF